MRNYLAAFMLKEYRGTQCPYCSIFIGWADKQYDPSTLFTFLEPLETLRLTKSDSAATAVGLAYDVGHVTIKIVGVWPFEDIAEPMRTQEYNQYCFTLHPPEELLKWSHETFLAEVCKTDPIGVVCAVAAQSVNMADSKMAEIQQLLQLGANNSF